MDTFFMDAGAAYFVQKYCRGWKHRKYWRYFH